MSAQRRVGPFAAVVLVAVAASRVAASRAGASPSPIVVTLKADCTHAINCESFAFSLKNGGSTALNGLTIQVTSPNTTTAFSVGGRAALGSGDVFKIFTTADSFATAAGQDVHRQTGGAAASHAAVDPGVLSLAYSPQWGGFLTGHGKTHIRGGYRLLYEPAFTTSTSSKRHPSERSRKCSADR